MTERRLTDFIGTWCLSRMIVQADGGRARFEGRAVWRPDGDRAVYDELGDLIFPGQGRFQASRRYFWQADLAVHFDDGRFFHTVPPGGGEAAHWCDPDQYDARYDFEDWPQWRCEWRVRGPRKDYQMLSRYWRLDG